LVMNRSDFLKRASSSGTSIYTRYHSKCGISVGIKMSLGKVNNLNIVILCLNYLPPLKVILNPS